MNLSIHSFPPCLDVQSKNYRLLNSIHLELNAIVLLNSADGPG